MRAGWPVVLAATLWAGMAAAQSPELLPTDPLFLPHLGQPDDEDVPEPTPPPVPAPVTPDEVEVLRRAFVGKPVFGYRTGRVGEVVSLATDGRGQPSAVVVRLDAAVDPRQGHVPVLWRWVAVQSGQPTLVVPWSAAQLRWLVGASSP